MRLGEAYNAFFDCMRNMVIDINTLNTKINEQQKVIESLEARIDELEKRDK